MMKLPSQPRYRKGDRIFWVMVKEEILLRNYSTNVAIQLAPQQRRVWELLDGAHTQQEIVKKLLADGGFDLGTSEIVDLIATLKFNGFLVQA